jgi:hypothetical protein
LKKKIPAIFLVLVICNTLIPFFHISISSSQEAYRDGEQATFTLSNKSLWYGRIQNVGWVIEKREGNAWIEVQGPSTYTFGLLYDIPPKAERSHRFELKVLEPGEYRYGKDLKIWGYTFRRYACFSVN